MLLELAIGDAYGAGFEYASPEFIEQQHTLGGYVQHPRHSLRPGCYTDDTQMSLAIAELIVAGAPWTPLAIADAFVEAYRRDPRKGYSRRVYAVLARAQSGAQLLAQIDPLSDTSGAAMRATPIGVFSTVAEVISRATVQAQTTHNTPDGINAAVAAALAAHYFMYKLGAKVDLGAFLDQHVPAAGQAWSQPYRGHVGAQGWMSVCAAITAVQRNASLRALLKDCVDFGGDVDTVATIALGVAACSREFAQDLPPQLVHGLEDGPYGRAYIERLDAQLAARVKR